MKEAHPEFGDAAIHHAILTDMIIDQIRKLASLQKDGILSAEEFAAKKAELLGRL